MGRLSPGPSVTADATSGVLSTVVRGAAAFAAGVVFARVLGEEGQGLIKLAVTTGGVAAFGVQVFVGPAIQRCRLSGGVAPSQLAAAGLRWSLLGGIPVAAAGVLLLLATGASASIAVLAGLLAVVLTVGSVAIVVEQSLGRVVASSASAAAGALCALGVVLLLGGLGRLSVGAAILAFGLTGLVPLAVAMAALRPRRPAARSEHRLGTDAVGALLLLVLWRSDTFLVAGLLSPARLGVYAVGVAVAEVAQAVSAGLRASLVPRLRHLDDPAVPLQLFARLSSVMLVFIGAAVLALVAGGRPLFSAVYGPEFAEGALVALLLVPGMWGFITVGLYFDALQISGDGPALVRALAVGVVVNLTVNLLLTRWGGLAVPALSSSLVYTAIGVVVLLRAARRAGVPVRVLLVPAASR